MKKSSLTANELKLQWQHEGISEPSCNNIAGLIQERFYLRLFPDTESKNWSRWGGTPSLPETIEPSSNRFLCQIALNEIENKESQPQIPEWMNKGVFFFFIHPKGRDKGQVLYLPEFNSTKVPSSPMTELASKTTSIGMKWAHDLIIPEYESDEFDALELSTKEGNLYMDWEEEFFAKRKSYYYEGCHMYGGLTESSRDAGRRFTRKESEGWQVLLSLHPKENKTVHKSALGDIPFLSQPLYYYIKKEDLASQTFENVLCRYALID